MNRFPQQALAGAAALVLVTACGSAGSGPAPEPSAAVAGRPALEPAPASPAPLAPAPGDAPAAGPSAGAGEAMLEAHNRRRAAHCAPPLTWSAELEKVARGWARELQQRGCRVLEHNRTRYGENLAATSSGAFSDDAIVDMWYREREQYDYRRARFSLETGHFTQLVWVATERLGCAEASCDGLTVWVCNYDPPGNVQGQFGQNVLPATCRK